MLPVIDTAFCCLEKTLLERALEDFRAGGVNHRLWQAVVDRDKAEEAPLERLSVERPLHKLLVVALVEKASVR